MTLRTALFAAALVCGLGAGPVSADDVAPAADSSGPCTLRVVARPPIAEQSLDAIHVADGPESAVVEWSSHGSVHVAGFGIDTAAGVGHSRALGDAGPGATGLGAIANDDGFSLFVRVATGVRIYDLDRAGATRSSTLEPLPGVPSEVTFVPAGGALLAAIPDMGGAPTTRLLVLRRTGGALRVASRWDVPSDVLAFAFDGTHVAYVRATRPTTTIWIDGHETHTAPFATFDVLVTSVAFVGGELQALAIDPTVQPGARLKGRLLHITLAGTLSRNEALPRRARAPFDGVMAGAVPGPAPQQFALRRSSINSAAIGTPVVFIDDTHDRAPTMDLRWSPNRRWVIAYQESAETGAHGSSLVLETVSCVSR